MIYYYWIANGIYGKVNQTGLFFKGKEAVQGNKKRKKTSMLLL